MARKALPITPWKRHFQKYEKSDLTIGEYCHRNGISQGQFYYWRKKLKARTDQESYTFKEIEVMDSPTVVQIRIIYGHGVSLEIEGSVSPGYIRQLAGC